ncbi:MAG: SDR family oxidoreductase [Balneolaceae bacterium]
MSTNWTTKRFIVTGASSGFGAAIARRLLAEGAHVLAVARRKEKLDELYGDHPKADYLAGDVTDPAVLEHVSATASNGMFHGLILNAGGPPTGTPMETTMKQWDEAWKSVMRWKVEWALTLVPLLQKSGYGRVLWIESKSVKEPIPELVLSNAMRAGVVGFAKSLASKVAPDGVTVNVIAPGSHNTPAIERVIKKRSEDLNLSEEKIRAQMEASIPVRRMGEAHELASLACWLLSSESSYVTGQTWSHDGGAISSLFG